MIALIVSVKFEGDSGAVGCLHFMNSEPRLSADITQFFASLAANKYKQENFVLVFDIHSYFRSLLF